MRAIFVSYRREDSEGEAGRLFDDLVAVFGADSVFMDVAAIEVGRDFRKAIDDSVATCGVLLAVIGRSWIDAKNTAGQRRLEDPSDFVRLETASALRRDIPVVPVLVRGAQMPRPEELPEDLKELAYRNGVELTHPRWNSDLQLLINALRPHVEIPANAGGSPNQTGPAVTARTSGALPAQQTKAEIPSSTPVPQPRKSVGKIVAVTLAAVVAIIVALVMMAPKQVSVPDLRGVSLSDATAKLEAQHLKVGLKTLRSDSTEDPNTVISQSPAPATSVKADSAVDLVIAQASTVEVPPLVGESLDDARRTLADRQLVVGSIERKPKAGVARDTVLQEFPVQGEKVKGGSAVDLMVSETPEAASTETPAEAPQKKPAASQPARTSTAANTQQSQSPALPAANESRPVQQAAAPPPAEEVINIAGYWHDNAGVTYQTFQRGNNFTYSASGAGGVSRGSGTIRGSQFESAYNAAYSNGNRSSGRCAGTISADGSVIHATCVDSVLGQTYNTLSR